MSRYQLTLTLHSDWHIGSGREAGAYCDALAIKNHQQLPYVPGKSLKGLLRQAWRNAIENGWFQHSSYKKFEPGLWEFLLFGGPSTNGEHDKEVVKTLKKTLFNCEHSPKGVPEGLLQITNAELSAEESAYFSNNKDAASHLFQLRTQTAIDAQTETVKDGSLRSIEVAVPMTLTAKVEANRAHTEYQTFKEQLADQHPQWLSHLCALITGLGAKRQRGWGDVTVTCEEMKIKHNGGNH